MQTGSELRESFIRYFVEREHRPVPSSPLLPANDPSLLFTNAGMVQFKDVFMGLEKRPYQKAVSAQKCIRLSGKHNDLENVGHTARHNTFFEMLGNFSFGDYFKKEAIEYAWDFLTRVIGLEADRLYATVFREDDEAHGIWRKRIGLPEAKVLRFGEKDNFWSMGETGPCGPCSELHFDRGPSAGCGRSECSPACECDRYLEVWNLVFMQFDRSEDGSIRDLPRPSIDTGMGLERLAMLVQSVGSNYETDLIFPLIREVEELAGKAYGEGGRDDVSMRILADHARAVSFLIADGLLPSNDWQGYVLRKLLRRALRHGRLLGRSEPFFVRLSEVVIDQFGPAYPELREEHQRIARVVQAEELRFHKTLDRGLALLEELLQQLEQRGQRVLPGEEAFRLYDTYGFPLDLTVETVRERGFEVDEAGFHEEMGLQRQKARASWTAATAVDPVYRDLASVLSATSFLGYQTTRAQARVLGLVREGAPVERLEEGQSGEIVLDRTPFYAASGGQVGDTGLLLWNRGEARVLDTRTRLPEITFHRVEVVRGVLGAQELVRAEVDEERRERIRLNHTATHLLHASLREVLGDHVKQAGSLVAPERLRFDYTHFAPLDPEEIGRIEELTNDKIRENIAVQTDVMSLDDALSSGAMALFGEKYGDAVRVVKVGDFSTELCGGTHVKRSGDIGFFKILSEESISAGVRRIEAVTGPGALNFVQREWSVVRQLQQLLNSGLPQLPERVEAALQQLRQQGKEIDELRTRLASGAGAAQQKRIEIDGAQVLVRIVEGLKRSSLRNLADELKSTLGCGVVFLLNRHEEKVDLVVSVTRDLLDKVDAATVAQTAAATLGGRGGGRADFAQAGGKDVSRVDEAVQAGIEAVRQQLATQAVSGSSA